MADGVVLGGRLCGVMAGVVLISQIGQGAAADGGTDTLPRPTVSYRADIEILAGSISFTGTNWYTPDKERRELGIKGSSTPRKPVIYRRDRSQVMVLDISQRTYFVTAVKAGGRSDRGLIVKPLVKKEKIGSDLWNGVPTTKYRVVFAADAGGQLSGHLWLSADQILMAVDGRLTMKGKSRPFKLSLSGLRVGPQPDALFEVPRGYRFAPPGRADKGSRRPRPASPRSDHDHK